MASMETNLSKKTCKCMEIGDYGILTTECDCASPAAVAPAAEVETWETEAPDCFYCGTEAALVSME